jgi:hypothetical protein
MERIKILTAFIVSGIFVAFLTSCNSGGPSQENMAGAAGMGRASDHSEARGRDHHSDDSDDRRRDLNNDHHDYSDDREDGEDSDGQADNSGNTENNTGNSGNHENDENSEEHEDNPGHTENNTGNSGNHENNDENSEEHEDNPGHTENNTGNSGNHENNENHDGSDIPVSTAMNSQQLSTVAFKPGQGHFLVVWNDLRNRENFDYNGWAVYGQFVNSSGVFQGHNFTISPLGVEYRTSPVVVHDSFTGRSLVVWGTTGGDVLGQIINSDGNHYRDAISIAATGFYEGTPALAFDPIRGRFFVTWLGLNTNYLIYGQFISREGTLEGPPFLVSEAISGKLDLVASTDTQTGRFLVVWRDYRSVGTYSIRGQIVNSDGTLYGAEISVADIAGSPITPMLAYDSVNHCFLVTWSDDRRAGGAHYEIYGQLVASDGVLMGTNFLISSYGGYAHALDFDPSTTHYLLTFTKFGTRIYGQYLAADGMSSDGAFPISGLESIQGAPRSAYDPTARKFFTVWTDERNGSSDIYGQTTAVPMTQDSCEGENISSCLECETDAGALVDEVCPVHSSYANHGDYLSCVTHAVNSLRRAGQISASCALKLVAPRARSEVGKQE